METTIAIQPVLFYPVQAGFIHIGPVQVHLASQTADAKVVFLDTERNPIPQSTQRWYMTSDQYAGWGGDDDYFISTCISSLGLTPLPPS